MNPKPLGAHVHDYYASQTLPESSARRLTGIADAWERAEHRAPRPGGSPNHGLYALAASIALLAVGNLYWAMEQRSLRQGLLAIRTPAPAPISAPLIQTGYGTPRLAAVQTVMANCPQCPNIRCVFSELAAKHADQPILFLTADLTNEQTRRQWERLAEAVGLEWVASQCCQTGSIQLADLNEKKILGKLTRKEEQPELEQLLQKALGSNQP